MKRLEAILAVAMAVSLTGCKLLAKKPVAAVPAAPAAAAQPLSEPQTKVTLPRVQPFDNDALATVTPQPELPPVVPPAIPAAAPASRTAGRGATSRGASPPSAPPKPETAPVETPRPQIQEILPADVQQRLKNSAQESLRQAGQLLTQAGNRKLTTREKEAITHIRQFIKISEEAVKAGDMQTADDSAARALSLAKDLQSGK